MKTLFLLCSAFAAFATTAFAGTAAPPITWDWYNAGITYLNYPHKGPNDPAIAAHYFRLAARDGNASAAYKLGDMFENGVGVPKSYPDALRYYRLSAKHGDKYADFRIGWFYQHGLGVQKDLPQAAKWYELAASKGNVWGYDMLAFMLADGDGIQKNTALAERYFEQSLPKTHDNWAEWKLAELIMKKDPRHARRLLKKSAAAGNKEAIKALGAGR